MALDESPDIINLQTERETGRVEKDGSTGNAAEVASTGDLDDPETRRQIAGKKVRLNLGNVTGSTEEKKAKILKFDEELDRSAGETELVGVYNATGEEKTALKTLETDRDATVSLKKDSATDLDDAKLDQLAA